MHESGVLLNPNSYANYMFSSTRPTVKGVNDTNAKSKVSPTKSEEKYLKTRQLNDQTDLDLLSSPSDPPPKT